MPCPNTARTKPINSRLPNLCPRRQAAAIWPGAKTGHHMKPVFDQQTHHLGCGSGLIRVVAVDQDIDNGLDIGEHASHDIPFALKPFAPELLS